MVQIIGLQMRKVTLILMVWSERWILDGIEHELADTGEVLRKGSIKLGRLKKLLLDSWLEDDQHDQALILDQTADAEVASSAGFLIDSGEVLLRMARDWMGWRGNGWASRNRGSRALLLPTL